MLGFDLRDAGFHVVLDRKLPRMVAAALGDVVGTFMVRTGLDRIGFAAIHAGGPRIMDAVAESLDLPASLLEASRSVYDTHGNTSSVSILLVLEALSRELGDEPLDGVGIGIGPGISIELLRLAWTPPGRER
jgi:alkylresorcinol/alkylpyrone synthase